MKGFEMSLSEMAFAAFVLGTLAVHLGSMALVVLRRLRPRRMAASEARSITLLRPVCGVEPFDRETLGSSFTLDYPAFDIIFCVADSADPAVALVAELIAEHPQMRARLLVGDEALTTNPKVNNLSKGWEAAKGELVVMADSNLLLPRDYLWQLVDAMVPGVGTVSSPPFAVRPVGIWGGLECAFLNGNQIRLQLAADALGFGFAHGKTMMWERAFLNRHGGLRALGDRLAEDVAATRLVRRNGLRVAMPLTPFAQPVGRRSLGQVWQRQLRWSKVRREGFPAVFLLEPLNGALFPVLAAGFAFGPFAAAVLVTIWYGAEIALARMEGWPSRGINFLLLPVRDLMVPVIWLATLRNTRFEWRGNAMGPGTLRKL
jgi:ceramide glucosyltransferase